MNERSQVRHGRAPGLIGRRWLLAAMAAAIGAAAIPGGTRAAAPPDDWAMFHHDGVHSGVSPDTAISSSSAPGLTQKWTQLVGGGSKGHPPVYASPAVVYNATLQKTILYEVSVLGLAHAFDAATGATVWTRSLFAQGGAAASPAVDGNTVYFAGSNGTLYALDATTGDVQCTFTLPIVAPETVPGRIQASPVVGHIDGSGPIVFFGDEGESEDMNGGHEWAVTGVGNTAGDCQQKWVFDGFVNRGPHGDRAGSWSEPGLAQDATGRWLLVFGSSNPDNSVYALDAADGTQVWRFATFQDGGDQDVGTGPTISAPGVNGFADGVVYINGKDKVEVALDLLTGAQIWSFNMATDAGIRRNSVSVASLVGKHVYVAYATYVYAFNAITGVKAWRSAATAGVIEASVAVSGPNGKRVLFIGDLSGGEYGYRLSDGALLFSMNVGHPIHASAAISDHTLFFASDGGAVFALG
jgi:outer membrane protein assembly factor BamB